MLALIVKAGLVLSDRGKYMYKRNRLSPNEIIIHGDYAEVLLYNTYGLEISRTMIDLDDINNIIGYKWHRNNNGYCGANHNILMHRIIMNVKNNEYIDHINGNKLDNRKQNLRICTNQENNFNKGLYSHNTSGVSGVSWDKSRNKWEASIKINRKKIHLGRFENFNEAVNKRKEAEEVYFGEFAYKQNII